MLQLCRVSGKNIPPSNATEPFSAIGTEFPESSRMMQYPSGVEYNLSSLPEKGYYEYIWVPLDAEDYNFVPDTKSDPNRAASMLFRNGIHLYAYGCAFTDKF